MMVYYNPYIIPGKYNPLYTLNNLGFFLCPGDLRRGVCPSPQFSGPSLRLEFRPFSLPSEGRAAHHHQTKPQKVSTKRRSTSITG